MSRILIVDDNDTMREGMEEVAVGMGHAVTTASSGAAALERFQEQRPDLVVTDLKMAGIDGLELLRRVRALDADVPVLLITAYGTIEVAVEAMKEGAFDFVTKPFSPGVLRLKIERALEARKARAQVERLQQENEILRAEVESAKGFEEMIGQSEAVRRIYSIIDKVAPSDSSVCVFGESGTGKELVARALHARSPRAGGPFVKVNCGALTETLLESELFGHEKGAFTGAIRRKLGRFELADGGTVFLDEIGDISPALQLKLLRVLQERELERVGGEETIHVDVRVISATHRDLLEEVKANRFREDLYYRLHIIPLNLPPLRDRREDIPLLAAHFLEKLRARTRHHVARIDDDALAALRAYRWPGNIRELENVLEQALVFAEGDTLRAADLPAHLAPAAASTDRIAIPELDKPLPDVLDDLERALILRAYEKAGGVKTETARLLGVKPSALYYKLEKYGILAKAGEEGGDVQ
jgi:two-component system response regulator HydG